MKELHAQWVGYHPQPPFLTMLQHAETNMNQYQMSQGPRDANDDATNATMGVLSSADRRKRRDQR